MPERERRPYDPEREHRKNPDPDKERKDPADDLDEFIDKEEDIGDQQEPSRQ